VRGSSRENIPTDSYICSQVLKGLIAGILNNLNLLRRTRKTMKRPLISIVHLLDRLFVRETGKNTKRISLNLIVGGSFTELHQRFSLIGQF
jgi:tRNA A37 threonylcarbamoyltransferase TsaD